MSKPPGPANRRFYSLPSSDVDFSASEGQSTKADLDNKGGDSRGSQLVLGDTLLRYISDNVIGVDKTFSGPFGLRKVTYLDFVASGRALDFIEEYIRTQVLPEYGNTHTTTSVTSLQTTLFRHEARDILRNSFNASEHDSVIFTGSGCTGAVHKLIHALDFQKNPSVVLVGPYEHHSNILPWKEAGAEVIRIHQTATGHVDMLHLEQTLKAHQGGSRQVIGTFSAASNVTGVLTDVDAITICLHKHGALAVWDYACAAPYVKLDMNPYVGGPDQPYVYKDAVVLSVHKFVGGISTPGVLMAKKKLFRHSVPESCGGGSVFFVRRSNHRYLQEPESREEGGTPAIVQSVRAGLVVQLKQAVGVDTITNRDQWLLSQAQTAWSDSPELVQLGPPPGPDSPDKLPIFSFLVLHPQTGRFLHHNFVAAVLNDVFGIQARGGCACAGPYAMDLLGLDEKTAKVIEELIAEDSRLDRTHLRRMREYSHREILRPGFVRLNLPYFMDQDCVQFVLEAVKMTAKHAWKLLPQYLFNPETAEWRQRHFQTFKDRKWLGHVSYQSGQMKYHQPRQVVKGPLPTSYQDCLMKAEKVFEDARKLRLKVPDQSHMLDEEARLYRWFVLPSEASACLLHQQGSTSTTLPSPVARDDLPFFPGRKLQQSAEAVTQPVHSSSAGEFSRHENLLSQDSKVLEEFSENLRNADGMSQTISEITREARDGTERNGDLNPGNFGEGLSGPTASESPGGKKGGMLALEEALKYADSILNSLGSNDKVKEVGSALDSIWENFDPKRSKASQESGGLQGNRSARSALEEVSNTLNQIWDSFTVKEEPSGKSAGDVSNDTSPCQPLENSVPKGGTESTAASGEKKISAVEQVNAGLNQIWEGFSHHKGSGLSSDLEKEAQAPSNANGRVDNASNETCDKSDMKNSESSPKGSNLMSALDEINNAVNHIWESCTPGQAKGNTNSDTFNTEKSARAVECNKTTDSNNSNKKTESEQLQPNEQNDTKSQSDATEDVRRAIDEIWERFTPRKSPDVNVNADLKLKIGRGGKAVAEVSDVMNQIWESFEGKEAKQPTQCQESAKPESDQRVSASAGRSLVAENIANKSNSSSEAETFSQGMVKALSQGFGEVTLDNGETCVMAEEKDDQKVIDCAESEKLMSAPATQSDLSSGSATQNNPKSSTPHSNDDSCTTGPHGSRKENIPSARSTPKSDEESASVSRDKGVTASGSQKDPQAKDTSTGPACPFLKPKKKQAPGAVTATADAGRPDSGCRQAAAVKWFAPPKQIFKPAVTALEEYSMLKDGDKVLVCLSGGKDSLSLLHTIRQYQFYARGKGINFELGAVTVDPMTPAYDPSPLKQYLASLGVPYFYESQCILETAEQLPYECASICSFCSRMKRGRIYAAARREGYNVLALGQHLDDLAESFLMSFFHNGNLNTMKAHYTVKQGDLRVIRPFVYVREADLRAFAEQRKLPVIAENCPACFEAPKERHRTKQLLAAQEVMFPQVYSSMMAALKPLMARGIGQKPAVGGQEQEGEED